VSRTLQIELKKISTERASLTCRRPDGSVTWSRVHSFFPLHDLTHFAVESELKLRQGFFGLVATGWDLTAFTRPGVAAQLPAEGLVAENLVGTVERLGDDLPPAEFAAALADSLAAQNLPAFRILAADELARIRSTRRALIAQWHSLPAGETMRLSFPLAD
jgi:hypothetical protein